MDSGWKYMYDKYNDRYVYVPLNGDVAGTCVVTDNSDDPWFSPAGFNRGVIKNAVKLAWSPKKADRDTLYKNGVNPVINSLGSVSFCLVTRLFSRSRLRLTESTFAVCSSSLRRRLQPLRNSSCLSSTMRLLAHSSLHW